jgi:hypothetical protein
MSKYDRCRNCGGDAGIHHYQTDQCPVGGVEAMDGLQEWKASTFAPAEPVTTPTKLAKEMTMREHFAAMAMQGLVSKYTEGTFARQGGPQNLAKWSVENADALIEALNKGAK